MTRLVVAGVIALSSLAHAESPKLAQARAAIDAVKFDDAQRLLVGALHDGRNSPAAVREIYRLSGDTSVVLGQRDVGEQYYRRWLALEPAATMASGVSPKLREPFDAARAYIAAHGSLVVRASHRTATEIVIEISSDPLAMVRSAQLVGQGAAPIAGGAIRLAATSAAARAEVLDEYGNILVEVDIPAAETGVPSPARPTSSEPPAPHKSRAWIVFAAPAAVFLVGSAAAGITAIALKGDIDAKLTDSGQLYFSDVDKRAKQMRTATWITAGTAAVGVVLVIPAAILFARRSGNREVVPFVGAGGAGVSVSGRF